MTSSDHPRILIIEDEPAIRKFLRILLQSEGFIVTETDTARTGVGHAIAEPPDAVILDLGLPDEDGLTVIQRLREWSQAPIIVLSARGRESDKIAALDAGADDYLTKPFGAGEFMARLRVALRHAAHQSVGSSDKAIFRAGELTVDLARREVTVAEQPVRLTPTEYRLLLVLVRNAGKVVTHRQLLKDVWGPESVTENQYRSVGNDGKRFYDDDFRNKFERYSTSGDVG